MPDTSAQAVLSRAVNLVATFDIIIGIIGIIASISQLFEADINLWTTILFLVINSTIAILGLMLMGGVMKKSTTLIYPWFVSNGVIVGIIIILSFGMAFSRHGYIAMWLPGLVLFRAFEIWIVHEFTSHLKNDNEE